VKVSHRDNRTLPGVVRPWQEHPWNRPHPHQYIAPTGDRGISNPPQAEQPSAEPKTDFVRHSLAEGGKPKTGDHALKARVPSFAPGAI